MTEQHDGRRHRRGAAMLITAALVFASATAVSPSATADTVPTASVPATVSADPLPTVQQNGVVYSQVTVGNIVYATGRFTETWPAGQTDQPGVNETARSNLLAYDITTGDLVTSFDHSLNAEGLGVTASPDGSTVYVVGDFTTVDGAAHKHIAAFDTATGALITGFKAGLSGETAAVTASSSAVYVGGNFFGAGGTTRTRLAAFSPSGALLSWAPTADDGQVAALTLAPDGSRVVVGGRFTTLDGQAADGMGSVDSVTGTTVEPWAINTQIRDGGGASSTKCGITDLSTDGTNVYGGGFAYGCGNFEGTFAADPDTGTVVWINDCHGDTYSTQPIGGVLYVASHSHDCSAIGSFPNGTPDGYNQRATAYTTAASGGTDTGPDSYGWNYSGQPDGTLLHWFPTLAPGKVTGQNQAAWSVTGNANYVSYGGEFPNVDGVAQQGLVRFAVSSLAPNKVGPIADTENSTLVPSVSSTSYGRVDLAWTATWDRDNANLTYTVLRTDTATGATTTAGSVTQASSFWQLPTVTFTDKGLAPNATYTYRIQASDPFGNA
ncbi:MAG: cell surface protein, partial [Jatrophihabitans endophyticus]